MTMIALTIGFGTDKLVSDRKDRDVATTDRCLRINAEKYNTSQQHWQLCVLIETEGGGGRERKNVTKQNDNRPFTKSFGTDG